MNAVNDPTANVDFESIVPQLMTPKLVDGRLLARFPEGEGLGTDFLREVAAGHSDPDALFFAVISIVPKSSNIVALTTLRGFLRPVQKALEGKR